MRLQGNWLFPIVMCFSGDNIISKALRTLPQAGEKFVVEWVVLVRNTNQNLDHTLRVDQ